MVMYFKTTKCSISKRRVITSVPKLSSKNARIIHNILHVRDWHGEFHFNVVFLKKNQGLYAKLVLLKRLKLYEVVKYKNILIICSKEQLGLL